ncbi:hypothetical protein ACSBR1_020826 [Camellia fascicularis]
MLIAPRKHLIRFRDCSKTHGKVVGDLMTPAPLLVCETTNLEDAVRCLLLFFFHIHQPKLVNLLKARGEKCFYQTCFYILIG